MSQIFPLIFLHQMMTVGSAFLSICAPIARQILSCQCAIVITPCALTHPCTDLPSTENKLKP